MADRNFGLRHLATTTVTCLAFALLPSCGGDDSNGPPPASGSTSTPTPTPTPSQSATYVATPAPFGLAKDATFSIFGIDRSPTSVEDSSVQLRWNSTASLFEILADGRTEWAQLKLRADGEGHAFDAFTAGGAILPFTVNIYFPGFWGEGRQFLGEVRVIKDNLIVTSAAFGEATPVDYVPTGVLYCYFGMDEVGGGDIAIYFNTNSAAGEIEPFYGTGGNPPQALALTDSEVRPESSIDLRAKYGSNSANVFEARLFGPEAQGIAVRSEGQVSGFMIGACQS